MNMKKYIMSVMAGILAISVCTSCGLGTKKISTAEGDLPIVKIWTSVSFSVKGYNSEQDTPGYKEMEKDLGVKLEYTRATAGQGAQQFNLLLASGDLPDIVSWWWYDVVGGPEKNIKDGFIYPMDEKFLKTNAPNFYEKIQENEDFEKSCKTDSGQYFIFPRFFDYKEGKDETLYTNGFVMRADWLKELGLAVPETIDEWHTALTAFKEKKGAAAPFSGTSYKAGFEGAFGIKDQYYRDGDTVKYGPYEDGYKAYLQTLNSWYNEGLLDKNIGNIDNKLIDARVLNNETGASFAWLGANVGNWINNSKGTSFDLVGVPFPVLHKGDKPEYNTVTFPVNTEGSIISGKTKIPQLAAKVLDYSFTKKGHMLANFGIEGESYVMEDGVPKYTNAILKNENGLSVNDARVIYCARPTTSFTEDYRYIQQYYHLPQQQEAQKQWRIGNGKNHNMPMITLTEQENVEYSKIMNEVKTYVDEMYLKFVMDIVPLSKFDEYRAQLKTMGIERAIEISQTAYNRYISR